jgi:hypothetical protein
MESIREYVHRQLTAQYCRIRNPNFLYVVCGDCKRPGVA